MSIPLASFFDDNSYHFGGNGVLDPFPVDGGGNGQLVNVVWTVISTSGASVSFRTDRWAFTRQTSQLAGRVWNDTDGDGTVGASEAGIDGVGVELFDAALGAVVATRVTGGDGSYSFDTLLGGAYEVRIDSGTLPAGLEPTFDPDGIATADQFALELGCDEQASQRNFGYAPIATDVPLPPGVAEVLRQNVPNPFNPRTAIEFEMIEDGFAELAVYDVAGRWVETLVRERRAAGPHRVEWDGRDAAGRSVASGVYYYSLQTARGRWVKRMTLLR